MTPTTAKPLRKDAAENREKVLDAARQVFAEHGIDGCVDDVATLAGVGMGTLYRRFPNKQALVDDLIGNARLTLLRLAREARQCPDGTGLERLLVETGQLQSDQLGCLSRLWDHSTAELDAMQQYRRILRELLTAAQEYGRIRPDATAADVAMVAWSIRGIIETTRVVAPTAWRRHLELLIAGLRPVQGARFETELRERAMTDAQVRRVTAGEARD